MLFQSSDAVGEENLVGELFKNFAEGGDDPAFLSSPESEFEFIQPPLSHQDLEYGVGVVPLSSPSIHHPAIAASNAELYPRNIANNNSNNKRHRGMIDIERWTPYNPTVRQYFTLFDGHQEEVGSGIEVHTKIDKIDQKEHFSAADEAFILYRQNQFQLDVDMFGNLSHYSSNPPTPSAGTSAQTTPLYVNVNNMLVPVECLYYHIYAVKQHKGVPVETSGEQESLVDLVQLGGPRNRKDFQLPGLCPIVQGRATYARLQFRAATPNNARVHPDQPNPNQQYYRVVLSLVAKTSTALNFIFSKISPCFMVRGQNPGKFVQSTVKPLSPPTPVPKQEQFSPSNNYPQLNYPPSPTSTLATSTSTTSTSTTTTTIINNNNNNMVNNNMINNNMVSNNNMVNNTSQITTNYNPFNPNPAQLPSLAAPIPTTPPMGSLQTPYRGTKRSVQGDEGWSSDGYGNVYTTGKVGVGMSDPQEALSVQGNILLTGDVLKPSDQRIKSNITPLSGSSQLDNIDRLKLYEYNLKHSVDADGNTVRERGVLAQELQQVMPQAVRVLKNVTLQDGTVMPELLVVHDRTLLYENIGATQELSRSVREQKSRLHALSESVAHSLHEMREGMVHAVSYLLSEKKRNYEYSCFFLSIFGLGPAWTMYMLGFFFPPLWFFGIFYISSIVPVKKTAGILHLVTLILFVIYTAFIIAWPFDWRIKLLAMLATLYLGVIVNIIFGIYWCRKMNEREFRINQGFELDCSDYDTNSMNLLLPPEAYSVPQTLLLEQGVQQQHKYTRGNSTLTPGEGETERGDIKSLPASNENIVNYQTFKQTKESNTQNTQNTQQVTTVSQQIISSRQSPRPSVPQFTLTSDDQKEEEEEEEKQQKQQHDGKKKTSKEKEEKDKPKSRKQ